MHFCGKRFSLLERVIEIINRQNGDTPIEHRFGRKAKKIGKRRFSRTLRAVDAKQELAPAAANLWQSSGEGQKVLFCRAAKFRRQAMSRQKVGHLRVRNNKRVSCHVCSRRVDPVSVAVVAPDSMPAALQQIPISGVLYSYSCKALASIDADACELK